jgi:aspartyl/asparaginyl-tRNA synthetase
VRTLPPELPFLILTFRLTNGAAVQLTGQLVPSPGSGQSHELLVDEEDGGYINVLGECDPEVKLKTFLPSAFFSNVQKRVTPFKSKH